MTVPSANRESAIADLRQFLGADNVRTDEESRRAAFSRWSPGAEVRAAAPPVVDAVALPSDAAEVAAVVRWANETRAALYPVGGASNIVNSAPPASDAAERPAVAVDLSRLDSVSWDEQALFVRVGAGVRLGVLEERLNAHGYTLGHFPQSLRLLTVGGSIAMDSVGLLSGRYGRQSDQILELSAVLPTGDKLEWAGSPPFWGAAFDLHRLLVGTEGAFGIVTEAILAMRPLPEVRAWIAFTFARFEDGVDALRLIYRSDARPALARLLDREAALHAALPGLPPTEALLVLCFEGDEIVQTGHYQLAHAVCQKIGGVAVEDAEIGEAWFERRREATPGFLAANARPGTVAETLALMTVWTHTMARDLPAVREALEEAGATQVLIEIAHPTPQGAALEVSFVADAGTTDPTALARFRERLLTRALDTIQRRASLSCFHHYGVGRSGPRALALAWERQHAGMATLRALKAALDPNGVLPHSFFTGE